MDVILGVAGVLSLVIGVVHSALGEILIFNRLRERTLVPQLAPAPLREKHVRILWATWHIPSLLGGVFGVMLLKVAVQNDVSSDVWVHYLGTALFVSGLLVLLATRARHPGWVGLCAVGVMCWVA